MRIANLPGCLVLVREGRAVDLERASGGVFGSDPQAVYARWEEFSSWAAGAEVEAGTDFAASDLGSPAPAPRQVLAIGLNYRDHAAESGFAVPEDLPPVFTKYATSITGPVTDVRLPQGGHTDGEVLLPGDVVFTGTPAGVGLGRDPQRWLTEGDELVSAIEGIGELRQTFTA